MRLARRHLAATSRASGFTFTGTHWITSPGGAGDYAQTTTNAAARRIFSGAAMGSWSFAAWVYDMGGGSGGGPAFGAIPAGTPLLNLFQDGQYNFELLNAAGGVVGTITTLGGPAAATWEHIAVTCDGTTLRAYVNGALVAGSFAVSATYAAADDGFLITDGASGRIRSPAIWARTLSGAEVSALNTGGVSYDPRTVSGGGPVHWWPADGDAGTTVTDRGSVGGCNLALVGSVTIGG